MGERGGGVVVKASEFKSKDPGFDPLAEQGEGTVLCPSASTLVQACLCCA